jgi:MerR family transcriptional regulator, repressor of the yfmOP operon
VTNLALDSDPGFRIGTVAAEAGTTTRTIRYYEEIGLLSAGDGRPKGGHRLYTREDVERVREIIRLRDVLGLSLDQLNQLFTLESERQQLKEEWAAASDSAEQRRILLAASACADAQLALVEERKTQLAILEREICDRRARIQDRITNL